MATEPKQLGISKPEAVRIFGGNVKLLDACLAAGWIKPVGAGRKPVFDYTHIENAWKRLAAGEQPEAAK